MLVCQVGKWGFIMFGASRWFVFCWLCVVIILRVSQHSMFTKFFVIPCCSIHLTTFDKKIPVELQIHTLEDHFIKEAKFQPPTVVPNCIQAMSTKTRWFSKPATAARRQDVQNERSDH